MAAAINCDKIKFMIVFFSISKAIYDKCPLRFAFYVDLTKLELISFRKK